MSTKKRIQYRYTSTGQRSVMIDPDGGRFSYSYDSVKRLTRVLNPEGQRTSFAYDNAGRRTVKKLANGSRTSFSYDAANRITSVAQLKSDGSVQAKYEYKYDKAGNRTAMAESGHTTARTTWTYDAAYQLTGEHRTGSNAYRNTYTYDNRGNRTLKNLDGVRTTSSYDDANQLKWTQDASGRTTYTFDADGNQQVVLTPAGQRTTSVWDYENKLVGVLNPSGTRETMAYDPDGKRVKHQTASETAKYVWDQENYLQETDASDVTQATYTNEPRTYGNLISQRKSGATHYYVFDALGSTRLLTDSSEAVSESLLYDAWGNLVGSAPTLTVPFRWVGELGYLFVPSTSDYYIRSRVYRPSIGRWVSKDPLGFVAINVFQYGNNGVPNVTDASGLRADSPVLPPGPGSTGWGTCERVELRREVFDLDVTQMPVLGILALWIPLHRELETERRVTWNHPCGITTQRLSGCTPLLDWVEKEGPVDIGRDAPPSYKPPFHPRQVIRCRPIIRGGCDEWFQAQFNDALLQQLVNRISIANGLQYWTITDESEVYCPECCCNILRTVEDISDFVVFDYTLLDTPAVGGTAIVTIPVRCARTWSRTLGECWS